MYVAQHVEQRFKSFERERVRPVGEGAGRLLVNFHKDGVNAACHPRTRKRFNIF
jgi:hypothetical protein